MLGRALKGKELGTNRYTERGDGLEREVGKWGYVSADGIMIIRVDLRYFYCYCITLGLKVLLKYIWPTSSKKQS